MNNKEDVVQHLKDCADVFRESAVRHGKRGSYSQALDIQSQAYGVDMAIRIIQGHRLNRKDNPIYDQLLKARESNK